MLSLYNFLSQSIIKSMSTEGVGVGRMGGSHLHEHLNDLLELSDDPYFPPLEPSSPKGGHKESREALSPTIKKIDLDMTRVSNRLLVSSRFWDHKTDKEGHRNNTHETATFLNARYPPRGFLCNRYANCGIEPMVDMENII